MNKGNSQYKINHFNRIIKINLDEYYGPIENNSKFDILIKEADLAFRTLDIHDANEEIWNILINRETESLLNSELKKLESKYPVKIFLNK